MHVCFAKSGKILIFQTKHLLVLVVFFRYNKTFWYQFCNFKHDFLKAENSEDILASSCEEICRPIDFHVTQYEIGLLLEL